MPQVEPQRAENHDEPLVMLQQDDGQPLHAHLGHEQPMNNPEDGLILLPKISSTRNHVDSLSVSQWHHNMLAFSSFFFLFL